VRRGSAMAEHDLLVERLIGYATSTHLPQMRRDLVEASELLSAYAALLDAWKAVFWDDVTKAVFRDDVTSADIDQLKPYLGQQFAELLGAAPGMEAWKRRLRLNLVISDDRDDASPEDRP
jgi:hypothetical protein